MSFSEWKEVSIKELCIRVSSGGTPSRKNKSYFENGIYNWIKTQELRDCNIYDTDEKITEEALKNSSAKLYPVNTVSMAMYGATVGKLGVLKVESSTNQACCNMIVDSKKSNYRFLYYSLIHNREELVGLASGAAQQNLNVGVISNFGIKIPSLEEQKVIADTLTSLDNKIELNNSINKTLEEMAQAIFKSWFVDFEPFQDGEFEDSELGTIPKGWKVGTLGDIANITMGQSPKGSSYNENGDGTVFYQGRTDFGSRYPTVRLYTTEPKRTADKGDILLSVRAPVGDINVAIEDCCIGRGLASLKSKDNYISYLLYQLLNLKDSFNIYNGEGTVFGSINKDTLNNMEVLIPLDKHMKEFELIVEKLDAIIENNSIQIRILTNIRDTLLLKLMSGEIRVPLNEV